MKKKWLIFDCIILMLFCQPLIGVSAISEAQKTAISDNCEAIKESLKNTQRVDVRTRVYLGGRFETVLTKFITPLNMKLVEKNMSNSSLIKNQGEFANMKMDFTEDFIKYQQALEELVGMDCKNEPEEFYEKLVLVRRRRKTTGQDITKLKSLIMDNVRLVTELRGEL